MDKMKFETPDMTAENIEKIAALFPNCVTEMRDENGKLKRGINFEMLKQMLSPDVVDGDERYEFTWVGKKAAIVEAHKPIRKTLRPCPRESKDWDTTENLYIEGDNLEVLKLLQESYLGKVKMIYIDPPYNTGSDFIYADDFMRSQQEENEQMGMFDEDENRLFKNTDTNGRFHSDWCSMIYSRLMLARNLLSDDGVIFISIDDNEVDDLKNISNEVFGECNFVAEIPWQSRASIQNDTDFSVNHEYICVYAKRRREENRRLKETNYQEWHRRDSFVCKPLPLDKSKFDNPDNDPRGLWKADPFDAPNVRPNLTYVVTNPLTGDEHLPPRGRHWRISPEKFSSALADGRIVFGKDGKGRPQMKSFYEEKKEFGSIDNSWFSSERIGTTTNGTKEVMELFDGYSYFDKPKPTSLLRKLIDLANTSENDIILDFFSGSATTAHAVMQLNAEERQSLELSIESLDKNDPEYNSKLQALNSQLSHTGQRKFIMVQIDEKCDEKSEAYKAGYKNICEIGKERMRRAGRQILELSLESLEKDGVIEKYAGELSEIRSLEEVYGVGGAGVSADKKTAKGRNIRAGGSDAAGGSLNPVERSGRTGSGNAGIYPVFESGKGITCGTENTVVTLRSLEILNELGYRVCLEHFRGDQQNAISSYQTSKLQALSSKFSLDIGFRVLKLDDSNMKDVYYAASEYGQSNLLDMVSNIKDDRTDLDLLFGCLLDWALPLSMPYTSEQIDGCTVHTYNDGDLIACFDENIPESVVKEIAKRKPQRAVFRDASFADSPAKINMLEIFKLYMPEDTDDISKRVRVI